LRLDGGRDGGYFVAATVTLAEIIPEPATILLFGLGTMFLRKHR